MNLIDFHVTKIIKEEYGLIYELMGKSLADADSEPEDWYREYLLSDGVKQTYEYYDDGGVSVDTRISLKFEKYHPGYVGQH